MSNLENIFNNKMFIKIRDHHVGVLVAKGLHELLSDEYLNPDTGGVANNSSFDSASPFDSAEELSVHQYTEYTTNISSNRNASDYTGNSWIDNFKEASADPNMLDPILHPPPSSNKKSLFNDLSFIDQSMFTPGCRICQLQFKHVYRDYVVSAALMTRYNIGIGEFLIVKSHINPASIDLGIVTCFYTVDEYMNLKQFLGRSQDAEENFLGTVVRVATPEERALLPYKHAREPPTLAIAKKIVKKYSLNMHVYGVEYQFDGKILYVYYTADNRVDYRGFVYDMTRESNNTRVKMKKTNQCRKFVPQSKAAIALATGNPIPINNSSPAQKSFL